MITAIILHKYGKKLSECLRITCIFYAVLEILRCSRQNYIGLDLFHADHLVSSIVRFKIDHFNEIFIHS